MHKWPTHWEEDGTTEERVEAVEDRAEREAEAVADEKNPPASQPPRAELPPMLSPEAYKALSKEEREKLRKNRRSLKRKIHVVARKSSRNNNDESAEAYTPPKPSLRPAQGPEGVERASALKNPIDEVLSEDPTRKE